MYMSLFIDENKLLIFKFSFILNSFFSSLQGHWICKLCENSVLVTPAYPPQAMLPTRMEEFHGGI